MEPNKIESVEQLKEGAVLLIDKPLGWTSFDVVNKIRWLIRKKGKIKKIKVGHAGTLDPLATGLLVICVGKMTKQIQHLQADDKSYTGTFHLGQTTPSFDLETEPEGNASLNDIDEEAIHKAAATFEGEVWQEPPVFSAKKVEGKRAYSYARKGQEVEIPRIKVLISHFTVMQISLPEVKFEVHCSKGTYIRTLANDFGKQLGCGAYLKALRRTESGAFSVENSLSVEEFESKLNGVKPEPLK